MNALEHGTYAYIYISIYFFFHWHQMFASIWETAAVCLASISPHQGQECWSSPPYKATRPGVGGCDFLPLPCGVVCFGGEGRVGGEGMRRGGVLLGLYFFFIVIARRYKYIYFFVWK